MKIMFVETLGDGGLAHYTFNLANTLAQRGFDIILFTSKNYEFSKHIFHFKPLQKMFKASSFLTNRFPRLADEKGFAAFLRRIIKLMEYPLNAIEALLIAHKENISFVHFQSVNEVELLMIITFKLFRKKLIYTIHNVKPRHGKIRWHHFLVYRLLYRLCNQLIIHSSSGKDEVVQLFSVNPNKITVIPHGDYQFFVPKKILPKSQAKTHLGITSTSKTILFFGAIRPNKGLDNLLYALPDIKNSINNIMLLIVGEPCENYRKYKDIIDKHNLSGNVFELLDYIPHNEVSLFFAASDVVVLPYNEITQSGVVQVAYAFGKPVVATALNGFKEVIDNNQNGFLVPVHDIKALAEKIVTLLSDEEKLRVMGQHSRHLSDTKFSWDAISTQTLAVYAKCT